MLKTEMPPSSIMMTTGPKPTSMFGAPNTVSLPSSSSKITTGYVTQSAAAVHGMVPSGGQGSPVKITFTKGGGTAGQQSVPLNSGQKVTIMSKNSALFCLTRSILDSLIKPAIFISSTSTWRAFLIHMCLFALRWLLSPVRVLGHPTARRPFYSAAAPPIRATWAPVVPCLPWPLPPHPLWEPPNNPSSWQPLPGNINRCIMGWLLLLGRLAWEACCRLASLTLLAQVSVWNEEFIDKPNIVPICTIVMC